MPVIHWTRTHPITVGFVVIVLVFSAGFAWAFNSIHHAAVENRRLVVANSQEIRRLAADEHALEHLNAVGSHGSCVATNALRHGLLLFVQKAVVRAEAVAQATIASPTATTAEKAAAAHSVAVIEAGLMELDRDLPVQQHCPSLSLPRLVLPAIPTVPTTVAVLPSPRAFVPPPAVRTTTTRPGRHRHHDDG